MPSPKSPYEIIIAQKQEEISRINKYISSFKNKGDEMVLECISCGHSYESEAFDNCPACGDDNAQSKEDMEEDE